MNKKILAVAVAAAMAVPLAASADEGNVTIYGQANVSVDFIDNDTDTTDNVSSNQSVFGIQGSEPLGNGLNAVFHWDVFAGVDDGVEDVTGGTPSSFFGASRDSWVGLSGGFGTVALGAQGRPWKTATNNVDFFVNTIADYAGIIGTVSNVAIGTNGVAHDTGIGNSIIWFGPNINGFSWHAQYGADEDDDGNREYGLQGNYTNGPLYATLAYDMQEGALAGEDVEAWKASLSYTFIEALTVSGIYDHISDDAGGVAERDAWYLGAAYKFGNNALKAAYATADDVDAGDDTGADYYALGLYHTFSKRTEVYALYAKVNNDDLATYGLGFPNATSAASSGASAPAFGGDDVSAFSIGLHHNF
ncbi:MAG: porin [Gammaproteobacteria bacterium]